MHIQCYCSSQLLPTIVVGADLNKITNRSKPLRLQHAVMMMWLAPVTSLGATLTWRLTDVQCCNISLVHGTEYSNLYNKH